MAVEEAVNHGNRPYRLLVADDHPLFREALCGVLASQFPECQTREAEDLEGALALARQQPDLDLILLDLKMPGMDGLQGLMSLRQAVPNTPVVILSAEQDPQQILQAVQWGAMGFISKSLARKELLEALQQVLAGQIYLPRDILHGESLAVSQAQELAPDPQVRQRLAQLTDKQHQVLARLVQGESNKQIAWQLGIVETTVKTHVSAILHKLGVHSRVQAILLAAQAADPAPTGGAVDAVDPAEGGSPGQPL